MRVRSDDETSRFDVTSDLVVFPDKEGRKIVGYLDHLGKDVEGRHFAVMAPKFGESKKNNLQLSYFFACNGLNVLRFDHTCHVGESEGDPLQFTLPGGVADIRAALEYVEKKFGARTITLVANSLSARPAIRAAARDSRVGHLVCVVGVVNFRYSMVQVYREDVVEAHFRGKRWGVDDVLGYRVDFDNFLEEAVASNMHDLEGTIEDFKAIKAPVSFFYAERDAWVDNDEVVRAVTGAPRGELFRMPGAMHEVRENPQVADDSFRRVVATCLAYAEKREIRPEDVRKPEKANVLRQNRIERERLRAANPVEQSERDFWSRYLEKYDYLQNGRDYREYLSLVVDLLGPIKDGDTLLDAGCGNGMFGVWILRILMEQKRDKFEVPPVYVGLDLTLSGLTEALGKHADFQIDSGVVPLTGGRPLGLSYACLDLDTFGRGDGQNPLIRFSDDFFDKICCSLVVSYLSDVDGFLRELFRILRPGGVLVVSSMKPYCDMSGIYRDYIDQDVSEEQAESARDLLRAAGAIKMKEEQGFYRFFGGDELSSALTSVGFRDCDVFVSFGNQAFVVRAVK